MVLVMTKYDELSQKQKQLLAMQYPYKKDEDIFPSKSNEQIDIVSSKTELDEFKRRAEDEGVSLMKRKNFIVTKDGPESLIDAVLGDMPEDAYRDALMLSQIEFDPIATMQELFAIEATRVRRGIQYEENLNLGLEQDTQNAITSLASITKSIHDMKEGQKISVEFENNLSSLIESMDLDDDERYEAEVIDAEFNEV